MNKNRWYRYRSISSGGYSPWNYINVPSDVKTEKDFREFFEERGDVPTWSEHYRKVEWKRCSKLPKSILDSEIRTTERQIEILQMELKALKETTPSNVDHNEIERNKQKKKWNKIYKEKGLLHLIKK
jgi:hypothetical protein